MSNAAGFDRGIFDGARFDEERYTGNLFGFDNARFGEARFDRILGAMSDHRSIIGEEITAYFLHRYVVNAEIIAYFMHRYNLETVFNYFTHRYRIQKDIVKYFLARYAMLPSIVEVGDILAEGVGDYGPSDLVDPATFAWKTGFGSFDPHLKIVGAGPGGEMCFPASCSISQGEDENSTFSLHVSHGKYYHPDNASSPWQGVFNVSPYVAGVLTKKFVANPTFGGATMNFVGVGTSFSDGQSSGQKIEFDWGGVDEPHLKLSKEGQTMATVESSRNTIYTCHGVSQEIGNAYGVDISMESASDFVVPLLNRQNGRPIDWLTQLWDTLMLRYKVRGRQIVVYNPGESGRVWNYDTSNIGVNQAWSSDMSLAKVVNFVRVVRLSRASNTITQDGFKEQEVYQFGQYTYPFDEVMYSVRPQIVAAGGGVFSNFEYLNEKGEIIAVRSIRDNSATSPGAGVVEPVNYPLSLIASAPVNGAKSCRYTWGARTVDQTMRGISGAPGAIKFKGTPRLSPEASAGLLENPFDAEFFAEASNPASQAIHGICPLELQADALIANKDTAQIFANRFIQWVGRLKRNWTFNVPLNLEMEAGDRVFYENLELGSSHEMIVTRVQHNLIQDLRSRGTIFGATEYFN